MLAFSLPSPVETAGAIAGFAAILGLAVLALLYFAQARELKRLREWAGEAPDRSQPTTSPTGSAEPPPAQPAPGEATDVQDSAPAERPDSAPAGKPVGAPVPDTAAGASAAAKPATSASAAPADSAQPTSVAPVGMGGPALASATASPEARSIGGDRDEPAAAPGASAPADAVPAPMTAAGAGAAGNGHGGDRPVAPVRRPPPAGARPAAAAAAVGAQRTGSGPDGGAGPSSPAAAGSGSSRPGWVVPLLAGLALLAIALLAFGAVQLISGSNDDSSTSGGAASSSAAASGGGSATPRRTGAPFSNGSTTVAVLNGTPVAGLAKRVADKLDSAGFKQGAVTNASDQARSATIVSFLPGNRSEAESVRKVLKVSGVEPMDPTTKAIACVPPNPCPPVVVTVGSDRG